MQNKYVKINLSQCTYLSPASSLKEQVENGWMRGIFYNIYTQNINLVGNVQEGSGLLLMKTQVWVLCSKIISSFLKEVLCSPRYYLFDKKYSKNSNIVKYKLQIIIFNYIYIKM